MINHSIHTYWRDWLALVYITICLFDFVVGAVWWNLYVAAYYEDCVARGVEQAICFNNKHVWGHALESFILNSIMELDVH